MNMQDSTLLVNRPRLEFQAKQGLVQVPPEGSTENRNPMQVVLYLRMLELYHFRLDQNRGRGYGLRRQ